MFAINHKPFPIWGRLLFCQGYRKFENIIKTYKIMKIQLRSAFSTEGRRMAGARALWVANGMKRE
ncbi:MAG: hypothetical protein MJZ34_12925, partial [Paludibacteraceae bacterium]|nr:hypothetical protein [Paludibacteraceae bacterium]